MSSDGMSTLTSQMSVFRGANSSQKMAFLNKMLNIQGTSNVEVKSTGVHQQSVKETLNESGASDKFSIRSRSGKKVKK